jgi:hypothetical protein
LEKNLIVLSFSECLEKLPFPYKCSRAMVLDRYLDNVPKLRSEWLGSRVVLSFGCAPLRFAEDSPAIVGLIIWNQRGSTLAALGTF